MSDPREPLHQPPNPEDLRRVPPANPTCARVRGLLRDFVDGDLTRDLGVEVEEHAHRCRVCAVELSRAEHERLMICRAFTALANRERLADRERPLAPGFSARVVQRLMLDESALEPASRGFGLDGAPDGPPDAPAGSSAVDERLRGRSPGRLAQLAAGPNTLLAAGLLVLLCAGIVFSWSVAADREPEHSARLVVMSADGAYGFRGRLLPGDGLGDLQSLWVGEGGGARVDWHDVSPLKQPAATLNVRGGGEVRLENGAPLLVTGKVGIFTNRPVDFPMADGSSLRLGIGEYHISAEVPNEWSQRSGQSPDDPFALADLRVEIDVVSGHTAEIVRSQVVGSAFVAPGMIGVYQGTSGVSYRPGSAVAASSGAIAERRPPAETPSHQTRIAGVVVDRNGQPNGGASVGLSFTSQGMQRQMTLVSEADGWFWDFTDFPCDRPFAIIQVEPASSRMDLGITPPQALPVARLPSNVQLAPIVLNLAAPLVGSVRDDLGVPRGQVRVLPCIVDELFGTVLPLVSGQATTDAGGNFQIHRLPARLPPHQHLAVILLDPELEPTLVPVPERGSAIGTGWWGTLPMLARRLRPVQLHALLPNSHVEVFEEVPGLPGESAAVKRSATVNPHGHANQFLIGSGRLWLRKGTVANPLVQELTRDQSVSWPRYRPSGAIQPRPSLFRPMADISGTDLQVVQSFRHKRLAAVETPGAAGTGSGAGNGQAMLVIDSLGHAIQEAQVFSLEATGPRGSVEPTFHGFTSAAGIFPLAGISAGTTLFVIAPDGSTGQFTIPAGLVALPVTVPLVATGRVQLAEHLRPTGSAAGDIVTLRFEFRGASTAGMRPIAVRFASAAGAWEVSGLPAGEYRTVINDTVKTFVVPAGGFWLLE